MLLLQLWLGIWIYLGCMILGVMRMCLFSHQYLFRNRVVLVFFPKAFIRPPTCIDGMTSESTNPHAKAVAGLAAGTDMSSPHKFLFAGTRLPLYPHRGAFRARGVLAIGYPGLDLIYGFRSPIVLDLE